MKKPWTIRLVKLSGGRPGPLAYAIDSDLPRFWTRRRAARYCDEVNNATSMTVALWVPVLTKRSHW